MANNRMYLVNDRLGQRVFVAKYYPFLPKPLTSFSVADATERPADPWRPEPCGWFITDRGKLLEQLQGGFDSDNIYNNDGPTDWRLEYESDRAIVTASHLSEIFLDITGLTPTEVIAALALVRSGKVKLKLPEDWRGNLPVIEKES